MAALRVLLLEGGLEENLADLDLVFLGDLGLPMPRHESGSLNGRKLADAVVLVCRKYLNEQQQTLRLGIVVFLKLGRGGLDPLCVG